MRAEGSSWRKIAKQLGVPEATVRSRCAENCVGTVEKTVSKQVA
jgi:putative DNA-invertase from lambdoid prophage Rac